MSWTNSDEIEEIFYKAHNLGLTDKLRSTVSSMTQPQRKTSNDMLPLYQQAFQEIVKTLD
tara:strand:- start:1637 stop:1816 length:180 start_codon:yes stop_codon:yes gene_type:complete